ncbi:alpha-L-fucosidase [Novipirellula artificiosorum]|uniref:Alpha-L-fucosidase n=1 Tax=Novipirellula artificiosorum TaxID=2528016 RepID=A0A5C6D317_9BACT|nr:alpha-L-fucosidase [Novipirellula artificiosorum]TWU31138.1 Alpha-L-fucosidase [Novipirellula artificiosorum]
MTQAQRLVALLVITCLIFGRASAQVFPGKPGFDAYGGYLNIKGEATGRFHLETINDRHFLVTPEGHGYIALGVCHTGEIARSQEYFQEHCASDLEIANGELTTQFREWGYNGLGYGGHKSTREVLPYFADCFPTGTSSWRGKQVRFPDVFSDVWKKKARRDVENMLRTSSEDPNLIGVYWDDIPLWDLKQAKRMLGKTWVDAIRELPADAPGKVRYERFLRENGADASDEKFLVLIARELYSTLGPITRELAPDALVFGERYAGWALPWEVIQEELPWVDVVSVQPGGSQFPAQDFERLYRETKKPIMICDHNISFMTQEHSNVMWNSLPDAAGAGRTQGAYLDQAFSTSYLIGYSRCQYIDKTVNGGQLKQGLLQSDGTPYKECVDWVRKNNWRIHQQFIGKTEAADSPTPSPGHNAWYWESGANLFVANHNVTDKQYTSDQLSNLLSEFPAVTAVYYLAHNNEGVDVHHPSEILPNPKGWDMTGAWKQACEASGKRFCVYVNSLGLRLNDNNENPGWVRRKADGQPYTSNGHWAVGTRMCVKSSQDENGFLKAYFLPLIKEMVSRYEPDGIWVDGDWTVRDNICWCDNCKKAWELKTGKTAVPTNPNDPDWPAWQRLHYERCDEYLKTVANAVHSIHPDC